MRAPNGRRRFRDQSRSPVAARYPIGMALARQSSRRINVLTGVNPPGTGYRPTVYPVPGVSRNCRFITLPLALRGSGSVDSAIVSGTL